MKSCCNAIIPLFLALCLFVAPGYAADPVKVFAVDAQSLLFYPSRNAPAQVRALNRSKLPAEISAILQKITTTVGERIKKDQPLALLDCRESQFSLTTAESKLEQTRAQLNHQKRELERTEALSKQKYVGISELDRLRTGVASATFQLLADDALFQRARIDVERCQLQAPFDGVVTKRLANEGEMIDRGQAVIELVQLSQREISARIAEVDVDSFKQAATYFFENAGNRYDVVLQALVPVIGDNSRSRESIFTFKEKLATIGTNGRLVWKSRQAHLPAYLLVARNGKRGVFVLRNNKAHFVPALSAQEGRPFPIVLSADSQLIVDGRYSLEHGQEVRLGN